MMPNGNHPDVTVVIPVHNREGLVTRTLQSVMEQTLQPSAVIVVDNASTDGTAAAVRRCFDAWPVKTVRLSLLSEPRPGAAHARNRGLAGVDTRWTMFFDSDDVMSAGHIYRAISAAAVYPDADIIGWDVFWADNSGRIIRTLPFERDNAQYNNLFHGTLSTQRYMARTQLFREAGAWNGKATVWDDIELGARLLALNPTIVKLSGKPTVTVYCGHPSITTRHFAQNLDSYEPALNSIGRTLGAERRHWIDFKRITLAAVVSRRRNYEGFELFEKVLNSTRPRFRRLLWRIAYIYTLRGGRGIARLLRPFM